MSKNRNCHLCEYYKNEYCENLELKPCYPQEGCEDFSKRNELYNCTMVKVRNKKGNEFYVLYDESRQLLFYDWVTVEFAKKYFGIEFIEESEDD